MITDGQFSVVTTSPEAGLCEEGSTANYLVELGHCVHVMLALAFKLGLRGPRETG